MIKHNFDLLESASLAVISVLDQLNVCGCHIAVKIDNLNDYLTKIFFFRGSRSYMLRAKRDFSAVR